MLKTNIVINTILRGVGGWGEKCPHDSPRKSKLSWVARMRIENNLNGQDEVNKTLSLQLLLPINKLIISQ